MAKTPSPTPITAEPELKRVMGPGLLLLFIIGDILGTGIYALTGTIAREVGGMVWLPFLIAFAVALMTAFAYLELVTKYPSAGGAAVFTHKAFGIGFLTFMVAFTVMASGITSSATASRAFAENFMKGFGLETSDWAINLLGIGFILLVMGINLYGVAESVKANVVLTIIELTGLLIVIFVGFLAMAHGRADFSRVMMFETAEDKSWFLAISAATSVAFFAMVGFEDSVNMAEETKDPSRIFPRIMLTGLMITGIIYVLVSMTAVAIVPVGQLTETGATPLLTVVEMGAPGLPFAAIFPFISMFAVANTALINMMMASRLLYGMAKQGVLPAVFGRVLPGRRTPWVSILFTTGLAVLLITFVGQVAQLGGTTALLLLAVFTLTNVAVLVLRKDTVEHDHFHAPTWIPVVAGACTFYLVGPWTGRALEQFWIAGILVALGAVLGVITLLVNRRLNRPTEISDPALLDEPGVRN
ncbi:MAG: APC family permease [Propionibacteriaceae bacterium]|nr:APC family permease [Propionibacteriaceae bacterium]